MTSLAYIFKVRIIFGRKSFICEQIFENFVALLKTFEIRSHFAGGISEQGDMQKRQFPKDDVRRVG